MYSVFLSALLAMAMAPMQNPSTTQTTASTASAAVDSPTAVHKDVPSSAATNANAELAPADPVITIHGLCTGTAETKTKSADCTTVVTKQQFDGILNGLNSIGAQLLPMQRRAVAEGYAATLINYEAAKKAGVERDPRFAEVMRLARMRAMGDMYREQQMEKANKISPQQIQAYYKTNSDKFEQLTLRRVTLPRYNIANFKDEKFAAKAAKVANDVHDRMVKGEDLDKLQKEAFDELGVPNPPTTKMGPVRRGMYAPEQEKQLFALKPGEVTGIIEQASAIIIFKMEGRETLTLDQAKDEIKQVLIKQNLEKQEQTRSSSMKVEYNSKYVGAPETGGWMPASQLNTKAGNGESSKASNKPEQPK
ncbi:MAG TPA: peptidylprolyl isomerase [Candidatus Angelobacter sp.]|nr:peptidylprolyl isomerase [Candidatus Angelobacter sp.]